MPNALETPWVTLEVNDVPLSLCNDLGRPNLRMISWSSFLLLLLLFFLPPPSLLAQVGKSSTHHVNVSVMIGKYLYP